MCRRIGFHVSIEGGLDRAVGRALERGCTALQVFAGNPRGWQLQKRDEAELTRLRDARAQADLTPLVVHSCYLINPCSRDRAVLARSVRRLAAELEAAAAMGADFYVLHPGSHKGEPTAWGVERAARSIASALAGAGGAVPVLLEGMASEHGPGGDVERLGALIDRIASAVPEARLGIAVDTCHAFGAGYDFRDAGEVDRLVREVRDAVGLEALRLLHVNDSRDQPGSRRDRHEHIGRGTIGRRGLANVLNHPALSTLPLILETPWESVETDRRNLRAVRRLLDSG